MTDNKSNYPHQVSGNHSPSCIPTRYIMVKIDTLSVQAFIDSGADCTIIREDIFQKLSSNATPHVHKPSKSLVSVTGESIEVLGSSLLPINLNNVTTKQLVQIIPKHSTTKPLILGIDWLVFANGVTCHFKDGYLTIQGHRFPALCKCTIEPSIQEIQLISDVTIPPNSHLVTSGIIQRDKIIRPNYSGIFQPDDVEFDIDIASALVSTSHSNSVPVSIINYSDTEYLIKSGEK